MRKLSPKLITNVPIIEHESGIDSFVPAFFTGSIYRKTIPLRTRTFKRLAEHVLSTIAFVISPGKSTSLSSWLEKFCSASFIKVSNFEIFANYLFCIYIVSHVCCSSAVTLGIGLKAAEALADNFVWLVIEAVTQ